MNVYECDKCNYASVDQNKNQTRCPRCGKGKLEQPEIPYPQEFWRKYQALREHIGAKPIETNSLLEALKKTNLSPLFRYVVNKMTTKNAEAKDKISALQLQLKKFNYYGKGGLTLKFIFAGSGDQIWGSHVTNKAEYDEKQAFFTTASKLEHKFSKELPVARKAGVPVISIDDEQTENIAKLWFREKYGKKGQKIKSIYTFGGAKWRNGSSYRCV